MLTLFVPMSNREFGQIFDTLLPGNWWNDPLSRFGSLSQAGLNMEIKEAEETDQAVELAREENEGWKEKLKQAKVSMNLKSNLPNWTFPKKLKDKIRQLQPPDPKFPKETRPIEDPMTPGLEGNQGEGAVVTNTFRFS
ncbi:hypothetical protein PPACK8108_LOCUS6863 [Phakopsora pachyrhizi]|uniref:Uncharacterized protein n=1 Tax=Phakopsora pachyrhizi TaxID=170000 RepID=A0AAV0AT38_PHAPC|nr:hypothetical protein PPACK8108_LOCUS6863 [Phakopsora pachyrhizi]